MCGSFDFGTIMEEFSEIFFNSYLWKNLKGVEFTSKKLNKNVGTICNLIKFYYFDDNSTQLRMSMKDIWQYQVSRNEEEI